ncbi:hypothetical protein [Streptomyces sp. CS014]|uniref:hypothetical protein n=1 Tax=Streptomyces sp. CS014 TaxID=2162707 RepID=UPI000D516F10|nr:hypothetical protein [Streptomyces sp. CS014]PVD04506.1 hypothetical protein DBP12_03515 [Streptomyces sp. CS014]
MPRIQPDPAQALDLVHTLFAIEDRAATGTTLLGFLNNGGRSKLQPMHLAKGRGITVPLAPVLHSRIADELVTAAHAYARAAYGRRQDWPIHILVPRTSPVPVPCPRCRTPRLALTTTGRFQCQARHCNYVIGHFADDFKHLTFDHARHTMRAVPQLAGGTLSIVPRTPEPTA